MQLFKVGITRIIRSRAPIASDVQHGAGTIWYHLASPSDTYGDAYICTGIVGGEAQWYKVGSVLIEGKTFTMLSNSVIADRDCVRVDAYGRAVPALATSIAGAAVAGFALDPCTRDGQSLDVQDSGIVEKSTWEFSSEEMGWDVFLSAVTAGAVDTRPPSRSISGAVQKPVGMVIGTHKIQVRIGRTEEL